MRNAIVLIVIIVIVAGVFMLVRSMPTSQGQNIAGSEPVGVAPAGPDPSKISSSPP